MITKNQILWVNITNKNCPTLSKYGIKPFWIMKRKMRNKDGEVWNNINFFDAKREAEKSGYRLPDIREMLALLEQYRKNKEISKTDKEFLGIEELSCEERTYLEWINATGVSFLRGGYWGSTSYAGVFALGLYHIPTYQSISIGFRCASDKLPKSL